MLAGAPSFAPFSASGACAKKKKSRRVGLCPCSPGCPAARRESAIIKRTRDPGAFVAPPSRRHPWYRHSCLCAPFVVAVIPSPARDLQFGWFCGCTRVCPELAKGAFRTVGPNPCFSPLTQRRLALSSEGASARPLRGTGTLACAAVAVAAVVILSRPWADEESLRPPCF